MLQRRYIQKVMINVSGKSMSIEKKSLVQIRICARLFASILEVALAIRQLFHVFCRRIVKQLTLTVKTGAMTGTVVALLLLVPF